MAAGILKLAQWSQGDVGVRYNVLVDHDLRLAKDWRGCRADEKVLVRICLIAEKERQGRQKQSPTRWDWRPRISSLKTAFSGSRGRLPELFVVTGIDESQGQEKEVTIRTSYGSTRNNFSGDEHFPCCSNWTIPQFLSRFSV